MHDLFWDGYEYLQQGGWVMIPLGLASLAMWALIADRLLNYWQLGRDDVPAGEALAAIESRRPGEDLDEGRPAGGLRRRLLQALLAERSGDDELDRNILLQHSLALRAGLRRNLQLIAVLAGVAPLLGLLGTVLGMIETFEVIALFGTGNAKAMAGGISVALVTTQAGLLIAVPGLLVSAALARRARRLETGFDEFTHLLDRALKNRGRAMAARA
jgi:biopolymer transport protein ExbB